MLLRIELGLIQFKQIPKSLKIQMQPQQQEISMQLGLDRLWQGISGIEVPNPIDLVGTLKILVLT